MSPRKKIGPLAAKIVVNKVLPHYYKSRIPVIQNHKMIEKILDLHKEYKNLTRTNPEKRTDNPLVNTFKTKLETTMPFRPRNVIEKMEKSKQKKGSTEVLAIEEDIRFLKSMMKDRIAHYTSVDSNYAEVERKQFKRQQEAQKRKEVHIKKPKLEDTVSEFSLSEDDSVEKTVQQTQFRFILCPVQTGHISV